MAKTRQLQHAIMALALVMGLLLTLPAPAVAQEALLTSDVTMDITGKDANDARAQAMHKAERDGLSQLLDKLAPSEKASILSKLDDEIVSAMVKGVEVLDEKIAGNRYRAILRVSYNAAAVNTLMDKPAEEVETEKPSTDSSSVLILPLYEEEGKATLFEGNNPWRDAWKRVVLELAGGTIVLPYGDAADISGITVDTVQAANYAALSQFFGRYGVGEVVVLKASYEGGNMPGASIIRRHVSKTRNETQVQDFRTDPQEDKNTLLYRIAKDLGEQINRGREDTIARDAARGMDNEKLMFLIPINRLNAWTDVRQKLTTLPSITRIDVLAISPEQVDVMIQFKGDKPALATDIAALGLRVIQNPSYWIVSKE